MRFLYIAFLAFPLFLLPLTASSKENEVYITDIIAEFINNTPFKEIDVTLEHPNFLQQEISLTKDKFHHVFLQPLEIKLSEFVYIHYRLSDNCFGGPWIEKEKFKSNGKYTLKISISGNILSHGAIRSNVTYKLIKSALPEDNS